MFEILNAMRLLGYEQRLGGRPLPDEDIGSVETIASQVLDRLRRNPYARGADVTKDEVHAAVTKYYTSVPPWPFWALLDGGHADTDHDIRHIGAVKSALPVER